MFSHILIGVLMMQTLSTDHIEQPALPRAYGILPEERGGQDMIETTLSAPTFGEFDSTLTLYRWWTDTCPYCDASLPALDSLREKYAKRGFKVVGVYHPKPPSKNVTEKEVFDGASARQFKGEVVIDGDWSQLHKWWLDTGNRNATSVSILVDIDGVVRFVHPGPVLFPSDEKLFAQENNDFQLLDKAIDSLLPKKEAVMNIYNHPLNDVHGTPVNKNLFDGQVTLIVNLASKCGLTPQYEDLQKLHDRYKDQGFSVVGFPCNDFGGQEPGDADTITACASGYGADFPIMEKVVVLDNDSQCDIYKDLNFATDALPEWNFGKYLIDQHGTPIAFFGSMVEPLSSEIVDRINELLGSQN
jgi:glutathione peroxidase